MSEIRVSTIKNTQGQTVLTTDASGNITLPHQVNLGGAQKLMPDQAGQAGKMLVSDGTNAAWQDVPDPLPSQSGNSGKFLSTDGSSASWGSVPDPVPDQAGNSGKFLSTDGSSTSWQEVLQDFAPRLGVKNFVVGQNFNADSPPASRLMRAANSENRSSAAP
jgi:hypothetical protein